MPRIADTSVLYALFDRADPHHERARRDMSEPDPILVPREILAETVHLIHKRIGFKEAVQAIEDLDGLPNVREAEPCPKEGVVAIFRESRGHLSIADSVVVQTCRVLAAAPLSYDKGILEAL